MFDGYNINFVVEKKADAKYAPCSAASVVAKESRDAIVEHWKWTESSSSGAVGGGGGQQYTPVNGHEFGSGYPSDPKTRNALRFLIKEPFPHECLRWSWKTVQNYWTEHFNSPIPLRTKHGINQQSTLF